VVGSDLDNDKFICDSGEACGTYSTQNGILAVTVRDQDVADINVSCGFDAGALIPASAHFALPSIGVTRLVTSP